VITSAFVNADLGRQRHISLRRPSAIADIERGKATGEFSKNTNAAVLVDAIVAPVSCRLRLRFAPLTEKYGNDLIDQVLRGVRTKRKPSSSKSKNGLHRAADGRLRTPKSAKRSSPTKVDE
jgi:Tetracyclin repressor-like, C-terminal domain